MTSPTPSPTNPTPDYDFHPLAETFPMISTEELRELADDIQRYGLREPIVLFEGKILDGRNRYRACKLNKFALTQAHFKTLPASFDPQAYVISVNVRRRHLTAEQKRDVIAKLVKADPTKSNRQIAETTKADHKTVGDVRAKLEATGEIPQLETTTGADGKTRKTKQKGKGKGKQNPTKETVKIEYKEAVDPKTALNAYSVLEEHLLDALRDIAEFSSFAHAEEHADETRGRIEEIIDELRPADEEAETEEEKEKVEA